MLIGLIRTILIIAIVYYGIKLIAKYVFPFLGRMLFKKMQNNYYKQQGSYYKKEGEIRVNGNKNNKKEKKFSREDGEYVDYEEVNE